jgi:glycosyltransferase involved in cell wall biosynthesis
MDPTNDARRRILFVVPSLRRAGAETQVIDLANALDSDRFEKHLACFEAGLDQVDRVDQHSVTLHRLARHRKLDLSLAARIAELIDDYHIDLVHCTLQISLFFAFLARWRARTSSRLIAAVHTTVNRSWRDEMYDRLLYRRMLARCDRVQFVCNAQSRFWTAKYPELARRAAVVYNGVDPARYDSTDAVPAARALRERLGIESSERVVACIAGLRPEKGHAFLLEAFARQRGNQRLLLAGDGPERPRIERLLAELGMKGRVVLLGNVADVRPVIAASDVTVLASTAVETFSIAMLESMAMEVPMVATDIGGLSEAIIPGETGDLVAPADVAGLSRALQRMLDDDDGRRRMGLNARRLVRERFSLSAMADATAGLITSALREPRGLNAGLERPV